MSRQHFKTYNGIPLLRNGNATIKMEFVILYYSLNMRRSNECYNTNSTGNSNEYDTFINTTYREPNEYMRKELDIFGNT